MAEPGEQVRDYRDNADEHRYEVHLDGQLAAFAEYRLTPGTLAVLHTETEPGFTGRGVAGGLVGHILDDARDRGLAVSPYCPFVRDYLRRHPEYVDLVPASSRERFEL